MKKSIQFKIGLILFALFFTGNRFSLNAQDSTSTITTKSTTTTTTTWYTEPWIWVVGAAVFIVILALIFRGRSSTKEVSRTTIVRDEN